MMAGMEGAGIVVVVEDDASMAQAMARVLRLAQLLPVVYSSAEQALEAGVKPETACMVVDVELPGMNGFSFCERVAAAGRIPPFVIITAFEEQAARTRAATAGAAAFLAKPFSGRALVETVRRIANLKKET
jgi:FixJ family two-component response regulator